MFVHASGQNVFFQELLDALRAAAARRGAVTETAVDHFPPLSSERVYVFVPHEYLPFTQPGAHPTSAQLRRSVAISSEQPDTGWFEQTAAIATAAAATLDINPLGLIELRRRGVAARRLRLGYVPEWDLWRQDEQATREIDLTFLGGHTPRRASALAACAAILTRRRAELRIVESLVPHTARATNFLAGPAKWRHLAQATTLLNVHRGTTAYFEWQRAVEAIANGCVVVGEHSSQSEPLVPGEHFLSTSLESLPYVLDFVLSDEGLLRRVRRDAYEFLKSTLHIDDTVEPLLEAAEDATKAPLPARTRPGSPDPQPKPTPPPPPDWAQLALAPLVSGPQAGARPPENDFVPSVVPSTTAVLDVVVAVSGSSGSVEETLRSLALSDDAAISVVVVGTTRDDHARRVLEKLPWLRAQIVDINGSAARGDAVNAGVEVSSAPAVLILEAGDTLYPHGVDRLRRALYADPVAAFSYGIVEVGDRNGAKALASWLSWDRARLTRAKYLTPIALVSRSAFITYGGYSTDTRLSGWEHHDLYCSFADDGLRGAFAPEIVARQASFIGDYSGAPAAAWEALLERHAFLSEVHSS